MTPEMSVTDLTLARRTTTTAGMLSRHWTWGRRDRITDRDPEEQMYEQCFPAHGCAKSCRDPSQPTGGTRPSRATRTPAWRRDDCAPAREARDRRAGGSHRLPARHPRRAQGGARRSATGGCCFVRTGHLARIGVCDPPPEHGTGRHRPGRPDHDRHSARAGLLLRRRRASATGRTSRSSTTGRRSWTCSTAPTASNVSFYPIDSRGLPASDAPIEEDVPPPSISACWRRGSKRSARSPTRPTASRS